MLPDGDGQPAASRRATLTKTELIEEVSRMAGIPRNEAGVIVHKRVEIPWNKTGTVVARSSAALIVEF
jgi:hypothetical protein